jgi:hypothetical protein
MEVGRYRVKQGLRGAMATPGVRGAGTARRNGHSGLAREEGLRSAMGTPGLRGRRERAARCIHGAPETPLPAPKAK